MRVRVGEEAAEPGAGFVVVIVVVIMVMMGETAGEGTPDQRDAHDGHEQAGDDAQPELKGWA
jgi:hypothetical protein